MPAGLDHMLERTLGISAGAVAAGEFEFGLEEAPRERFRRAVAMCAVDGPDEGFEGVLLHTERGEGSTSEVYLLRVAAGVTRVSPAHAPGVVEQLVVLAGACRVEYADRRIDLPTGGHATWPADVPHRYTATGAVPLRAVNVIVTPA